MVGDQNFGTSLRSVLASRLTGYNLVTGTSLGSHDVTLTIDAALNETAYAALNGRKGWWRCMTIPRETCCVR